jgi:hypothetical protein
MRRGASLLLGLTFAVALASCGGGNGASTANQGATASTAASNCGSGDLRLSLGRGSAATGHVESPILIRNASQRPCTLRGYPSVTLLGANGQALGVEVKPVASDFFGPVPDRAVPISAGGQASFRLVTSNGGEDISGCPNAKKARVELPDSAGTQTLRFAAVACPGTLTVSRIGRGDSAI